MYNNLLLSEKNKNEIKKKSVVELFETFCSSELKNYIIKATNENGYPLTTNDFNTFLGILIFTSFNSRPSQTDYWSNDIFLKAEPVAKSMSRNKFQAIKSHLKCALPKDKNDDDKVTKLRPILNIFKKNILTYGFFDTALSVDEMMVKFFGRLSIKQFIKNKPIRFGIKMWSICGSNGFMYYFDVYCGKSSEQGSVLGEIARGSRVVVQMLQQLLTKALLVNYVSTIFILITSFVALILFCI